MAINNVFQAYLELAPLHQLLHKQNLIENISNTLNETKNMKR